MDIKMNNIVKELISNNRIDHDEANVLKTMFYRAVDDLENSDKFDEEMSRGVRKLYVQENVKHKN